LTSRPISPYHQPGFYDRALAKGQHRDIVGGRWDETGRAQMQVLQRFGLRPDHHLLDIGAGSLRLGCKAVPYLNRGHYWATDKSLDLMRKGRESEMADPEALLLSHLIEDEHFQFPGLPATITHAIAFAVFTHLPLSYLAGALPRISQAFPALERLLITLFLAPSGSLGSVRQADGVVTHPDRAPYHQDEAQVLALTGADKQLTVVGGSDDVVNIAGAIEATSGAPAGFKLYNLGTSGASILVEDDIAVNTTGV
jgi:hypothetical protein